MRTLSEAICVAETESIPWKHTLNAFLRKYCSIPHSTTEASLAELMFQRKIHTKIHTLTTIIKSDVDQEISRDG